MLAYDWLVNVARRPLQSLWSITYIKVTIVMMLGRTLPHTERSERFSWTPLQRRLISDG